MYNEIDEMIYSTSIDIFFYIQTSHFTVLYRARLILL